MGYPPETIPNYESRIHVRLIYDSSRTNKKERQFRLEIDSENQVPVGSLEAHLHDNTGKPRWYNCSGLLDILRRHTERLQYEEKRPHGFKEYPEYLHSLTAEQYLSHFKAIVYPSKIVHLDETLGLVHAEGNHNSIISGTVGMAELCKALDYEKRRKKDYYNRRKKELEQQRKGQKPDE